ncbi:hypothetical protein C0992_003111 [Termitomyces sp. T32_za158]|nr:hypothetical protein C0992_003111 [Termitomyces sp. T32_za158]
MTGKLPPPSPGTYRKQGDISRMVSQLWHNESKEVKAEYQQLALMRKLEHEAKYPGYKYSPRSKEQRERERGSRSNETNSSVNAVQTDFHDAFPGTDYFSLYSSASTGPAEAFEMMPTTWSQQDMEEVLKTLYESLGGSDHHTNLGAYAAGCANVQLANEPFNTNQSSSQAYGEYIPSSYEASLDSMLQELTGEQTDCWDSGEIVVDFGSGSGIDILLAALKVGPRGQAIGIDASAYTDEPVQDMVTLARQNATKKGLTPPQVAFVQASLTEPLPITPNTVDCILSNCVINLLPHDKKEDALKEAHRILKPGGRLVLDDVRYAFFVVHG